MPYNWDFFTIVSGLSLLVAGMSVILENPMLLAFDLGVVVGLTLGLLGEARRDVLDVDDERDEQGHRDDQGAHRGLICMFCEEDGFATQDELEAHIDEHPYTAKKPVTEKQ